MVVFELNDIWRKKSLYYELRFYYTESNETADISSTRPTVRSTDVIRKDGPFKILRAEWFLRAHGAITREIIRSVIDRFGHRFGVNSPPGENTGSIDYEINELKQLEEFEPGREIPKDVLDRIERLEGLISDSKKTIREYEDMIADILAKKEEDRSEDDKAKLLRLDGYIRSENESIRKFELEISKLKKTWEIP